MKNFLRTLRFSWLYRTRLFISIFCALMAAALWGLNFTVLYPVLTIFEKDMTLQQWVDKKIDNVQGDIDTLQADIVRSENHFKLIQNWPEESYRSREELRVTNDLRKLENRLDRSRTQLWRYQQFKRYFIRFLPNDRFETLACLLALVVLGVALKGIFEFWQEWLVGSVTNRTLYDLRNRFYHHAIHQDLRQFQNEGGSAELMARFTNDMEMVGAGIKILYGKIIAEPLKALSCVIIACWFNWQLTLLFMVLIPAALFLMTKTSRMMKRATKRVLERMSNIYRILQESFQGIKVVKAFTMEPHERRRFKHATREYHDKAMRVITIDALASPLVELLGVAAVSVALLAGAYLVLTGEEKIFGVRLTHGPIETATLLQLFTLLAATADPVRKLSSVYNKLQSAAAASDRIFSQMDKMPSIQSNSSGPRLGRDWKTLEFRDICFSYHPGKPVLTNISLTVTAGEMIAIVGPNGCGKSTLLGLIPRFYDADHGAILLDGIDVREANLRTLRKQIGIVTQDTILFDDTIYNNLLYGNRKATREEVEEAAKKAFAHEFILELPHGYETIAGEVGKHLSGGQKQRIALARAILRDPAILILDEHTSQIDSMSESLLQKSLNEFRQGRTTFLITHRMNNLEMADRIMVLDGGRVVALGTHTELLISCPLYRQLQESSLHKRAA